MTTEFVFATAQYDSGDWDSAPLLPANIIDTIARYTEITVAPTGVVAPLSDARLAALLDWVFGSFGNNAAPGFSEAEVHAARRQPFVDPKAARAALD